MGTPRGQSRLGVGSFGTPRSSSGRRADEASLVED
nr:MAG TPA: hypothetical protein [Caudoviricetes sp.]